MKKLKQLELALDFGKDAPTKPSKPIKMDKHRKGVGDEDLYPTRPNEDVFDSYDPDEDLYEELCGIGMSDFGNR